MALSITLTRFMPQRLWLCELNSDWRGVHCEVLRWLSRTPNPISHHLLPLIRPCLTWGKRQSSLKALYKRKAHTSTDTHHVSWRRKGDSQTSVRKEGLIYTPTHNPLSPSRTVEPPFLCLLARRDLLGLAHSYGHWATTHLQTGQPTAASAPELCLPSPQQGMSFDCLPPLRRCFTQLLGAS